MTKKIRVSLARQILIATEDNKEVFRFDCATGDNDHPTTAGHFGD